MVGHCHSACHPQDRSEVYLDHLHSYVHYTKASQLLEDIFVKMITNTMLMNDTPKPLEDAALPMTNPSDTGMTNSTMRLRPDFNSEHSGDDVDLGPVEKLGSDKAALELGGDEAASESGSNEGGPEPSGNEAGSQPDSDSFGAEFQCLLHHLNGGGWTLFLAFTGLSGGILAQGGG
ncbi:hypothetical protein L208DRAFT_1380932 [Tricholoma matsutake]|nr:hypothetical protein L208DRAFT_1380932 [Tricholoma matsutake 945]